MLLSFSAISIFDSEMMDAVNGGTVKLSEQNGPLFGKHCFKGSKEPECLSQSKWVAAYKPGHISLGLFYCHNGCLDSW